jgi:hydrogenase nickel incorporation protein HypB
MDLLPYLRFNMQQFKEYAHRIHPGVPILETSVYTQQGMDDWLNWLRKKVKTVQPQMNPAEH